MILAARAAMPESAKLTALAILATLGLQVAAGMFGPAGVFFNLMMPLPICYLAMRGGAFYGGAVLLAGVGLQLLLGGMSGALSYLLQFGIGGFVLGLLLGQGKRWDVAVLVAGGCALLAAGLVAGGFSIAGGAEIGSMIDGYLNNEAKVALEIARDGSLPPEQLAEFEAVIAQMIAMLKETFVSWVVVVCYGMLLLQLPLMQLVGRRQVEFRGPRFAQWKAPELLIWPLIAAGFGVFFLETPWRQMALNVALLLLPVYFIQGMAVVTHFFSRKGVPVLFRAAGYVILTLFNPLPLIVAGIGVFDLWADFRRPRLRKD